MQTKSRLQKTREIPWYGPGAFAIITCVLVFGLIFLIRKRTFDERAQQIQSDMEAITATIESQVASIRDFLVLMSDDFSDGRLDATTFGKRADRYISENEEVTKVQFVDQVRSKTWVAPETSEPIRGTGQSIDDLKDTSLKFYETTQTSISKPYLSYNGNGSIAVFVTGQGSKGNVGDFGAEINIMKLIEISVNDKLASIYLVELVEKDDRTLGSLKFRSDPVSSLSSTQKISYFNNKLFLRLTRYQDPVDFQFFGLASICIGLAFGLAWAMWMLGKDNYRRKRIQIELERTKNAAEAANKAKSELIANISHEIRTPLGAIQGFADLIAGVKQSPADERISIHAIRRNSRNLLELINDLLDLSKIEAGLLEIEKREFFVGDKVSEVVELFSSDALKKDLTLKVHYEGPIPESIRSDPKRLGQVLINLIGNAIKFTDYGEIVLTIKLFNGENDRKLLGFIVQDTGIGIPDTQINSLFRPFSQADSSIGRKYGGTGLGLSLSKRLCQMLGGNTELVQSKVGVGSTFRAYIDPGDLQGVGMLTGLHHASHAPVNEGMQSFVNRLDNVKVLIIEDCNDNQIIYTQFIEFMGGIVETADDGQSGLAKAKSGDFDVILLDIQMPNMDGYTTARELRKVKIETPIIALTAHAMKGERKRCIDAGANEYLTKPVEPEVLIDTIGIYAGVTNTASKLDTQLRSSKLVSELVLKEDTPIYSKYHDDPRVKPVLPNFLKGLDDRILKLKQAIETEDWNKVNNTAHSFKGTALNYGYPSIAECVSEIEEESRNGRDKNHVIHLLKSLESLTFRARQTIVI